MAFARTAAVAGSGTVSCAGTTTVTGSGTAFAFALGGAPSASQPRVGGTITVGGVTKTIVAITSATSLTVDSAFGTFSAQAFTCQTGITQTGADTMNLSLVAATGFTITNRGDLFRTFDAGGQDLFIEGALTVESRVAQLRNDGSCANRFEVRGSATGGEIIFNGRKAAAANAPFPYAGFDWIGQNGLKVMKLVSSNATYPAKFTIIDACVRFGADWLTTDSGNFARITTQGDECWILCARGTGTSQARIRQDNTTATIDFQAAKTWVGLWLNFGVPQLSLKGYTPIDTDGPEINLASVPAATRVVIEDYNTTHIVPNYYAGAQIVLLGGAWTRIKNNLRGTNIVWMSSSASGRNVLEFSKQITIKAQDAAGNLLSDGFMYYQPVGSNVAGIRAKGGTADITFDLTQQAIATVGGVATSEFPYAWGYTNANGNQSVYNYFCTGTTKGSESHVIRSTRYGYDKQSAPVTLAGNSAATPTFVHASLPTTNKVIANAAAITGVEFDFSTKTMTVTGTLTTQQTYDAYQYQLNQAANLQQADECTVANGRANYVGWTIVVDTSATLTQGGNFTSIQANVITLNGTGKITAVYATPAGTSTVWQFQEVEVGSSLAVYDAMGVTKYYQGEVTTTGTFSLYIPPGVAETYTYAVEKYPYKRETGTFPANAGGVLFYVPGYAEDVGISELDQSVVSAYASLETPSKVYDRTAVFRLTEQGIKIGQIFTRSGSALEVQAGYNHLINKDATSVIGVSGGVITTKSTSYAGDAKYTTEIAPVPATVTANTNEVITIQIEDANGNSQVTIQGGSGSFTLWKIPNSTPEDSYATGVNLGTFGNVIYRFLSAPGYKIVIRDGITGYRQVCPMDKGSYIAGLFYGGQVQLAQSAEVTQINSKVDVLKVQVETLMAEIEAVKGAGFASTDSLVAINSNVNALPLLTEIEASTVLAKESSITALGAPLQADDYVVPDNATIASIDTKVASIGSLVADLPLLSEIEASTVLAKESSIAALGSPMQADDYVAPDNATISEIKTAVDGIDFSGIPADVWGYAVRTLTTAAGLTEEQVTLLENIKSKTDLLPAEPAGVGDAMTLTSAYDASKTAASQSSVTALGSPLQAGDYVEPDNAGIAVLVTDVGNVPDAVRQELAVELSRIDVEISTRSDLTVEDIPEGLTVAEIEASAILAKEKSVQNTMAIAASRIAF